MKRDKLIKSISVAVLLSIVMNNAHAFSLTKEKAVDPLQSKIDMLEQQVSDLSEKIHRFEVYFSKGSQATDLLQTHKLQTPKISTVRDEIQAMSNPIDSAVKKAPTQRAHDTHEKVDTEAGLYQKIIALIESKDYDKAENHAQKYIQVFHEEKNTPSVYFWLGEIKMLFGDLTQAKTYYQKSLELLNGGGRTPEVLLKISVICYQKGEPSEGDYYYEKLKEGYPGSTALHMARAQRKKYRVE